MGRGQAFLVLCAIGGGWGLTLPLLKISVSTGYAPLGLILWHKLIMAAALGGLLIFLRRPLALARRNADLFLGVALFGALLPGYFSFLTAGDLPAGVRSAIIAVVPMFALPLALLTGFERPDARRAVGVVLGALAIVLIAMPGSGLPPAASAGVLLLALITPFCYGIEANFLVWRGSGGLHPVEILFGASLVGVAIAWPMAAATGQLAWPANGWGVVEWAVLISGLLNAAAYSGYVWLVGQAGSVFASQVAYLVTAFGVVWSMVLLGERYSVWVWAAFLLMMVGVALVQPRGRPDGT